ncbi:MAG: hypothetical protein JSW06_06615 [Thermoplasmatales archaeon]|nr:MAG: hypothetical protein JSW06_06615 [Thermoplasmatales archaeon]
MNGKRTDEAISDLLGTMLLLSVAVSVFSVISLNTLSGISLEEHLLVTIGGTLEGNNIILTHRGGESLPLESEVMFTIAGAQLNFTAGQLLDDKSKQDGLWTVGELIVYNRTNLTGLRIEATVVEVKDDTTLFMGILQHG